MGNFGTRCLCAFPYRVQAGRNTEATFWSELQIKNVPIADQECAKQAEPELGGIDTCTKAELVQQLSALVSQREALAFSEEEQTLTQTSA